MSIMTIGKHHAVKRIYARPLHIQCRWPRTGGKQTAFAAAAGQHRAKDELHARCSCDHDTRVRSYAFIRQRTMSVYDLGLSATTTRSKVMGVRLAQRGAPAAVCGAFAYSRPPAMSRAGRRLCTSRKFTNPVSSSLYQRQIPGLQILRR